VDNRGNYHLAVQNLAGDEIENPDAVSLSLEIPSLVRQQNHIYARIGVKIRGVEHMMFSPVQKLDL
jgi:hypothetical protein